MSEGHQMIQQAAVPGGVRQAVRTSPAAADLLAAVSDRIVARMDAVAREARDSDSDHVRLWGVHEGLGEAYTMLMEELRGAR